jgi:hypothetical protein
MTIVSNDMLSLYDGIHRAKQEDCFETFHRRHVWSIKKGHKKGREWGELGLVQDRGVANGGQSIEIPFFGFVSKYICICLRTITSTCDSTNTTFLDVLLCCELQKRLPCLSVPTPYNDKYKELVSGQL